MKMSVVKAVLMFALGFAATAQAFTLDSPTIKSNGTIPLKNVYTKCGGENISPPLQWHDVPRNTKSFAVSVFDPDAHFWHWVAFNIDVGAHGLNPGAGTPHSGNAPGDTMQLENGFGKRGYSGPCPPAGAPHHYVFSVYALAVPLLRTSPGANAEDAIMAIKQHAIATATLTATYGH